MAQIAIIEPRSSGRFLVDRARQLGHDPIVVSHHRGDRRLPDRHLASAHRVVVVDTNDDAATLAVLRRLSTSDPVDAVLPGCEHYVPLAARAAVVLGLPGIGPAAAMRLRYKHRMRRALARERVPQPAFKVVTEQSELPAAVKAIGLPCVVKPVDQSGSVNVRLVSTVQEARDAYHAARHPSEMFLDRAARREVLVEEYVRGDEFSVEGYVEDGRTHVLGVTEKVLGDEPYFVERGHVFPADLPRSVTKDIAAYVATVVRALGLRLGPFHAEVRLSDRGPVLMEVAARLPGDRIPALLSLARGIDLYEIMIRSYLGLPNGAFEQRDGHDGVRAGIRFFVRPDISRYSAVAFAAGIETDPRVREIRMLVPPGSDVPRATSSFGRLGYVLATGSDYRDTVELLDAADRNVVFR